MTTTAVGKMTAKGQITIPRDIRDFLQVKPGDLITWETTADGGVRVRRADPLDLAYLGAVQDGLSEWNSDADTEAYRDL
ncbi:AbrB/MazE/SpoVT family DNA-binding domain-containing protein [Rhodoferax sp. 4810]|uniref:AbrB/MazE/SpoVT family DNA-binding domain-containing protein n=1 Tax=Thiospirillum jenense TaxID=1653858 RepID=A0A839H7A8_9GAMM|nr:AbrB/MazE/SpoVT family DNA-binding domain-containing protein [Thiospirillum jenense]MBB1074187.1 AbrB/MazE/SpoVT family DNA-binding domain-containing protein [Rhodoferax jenense]MBB1125261.1 AbrB/MazE/SpoVT family DNA-binding domain-containing protein [Thiospirillum jenense]